MADLSDELTARLTSLGISGVHPLPGGASSLTYAGERTGRQVVVKVAPVGVAPVGHRDVLRQARIMRALAGTSVPVPEVLAEDAGDPPLFVMTRVDGTSVEPLYDTVRDGTEDEIAARYHRAAEAMAALHRLRAEDLGVADEPVVSAADEIERWCRTLETVDPALVPGWPDLASALRASTPPPMPPAVVHGDFRLGNLLCIGSDVSAVIDWEIWTVGDPRIDAGWFLINSDPVTYRRDTPYVGVTPSPEDLAATYTAVMNVDVPQLDWFRALACFKSTATWSLIVKHNRRRPTPRPELEAMAPALPSLLARARDLLT
jgi:aminoglycoside phosphotransferase (APT) family kinase protein